MKRFRVLLLHALRLMLLLASRQVLTASASRVILQDSPSPSPSPSPDSESPSPDYSPELESPSPSPSPEYDPTAESPSPSPTPDSSPSPSPSSPNPAASPSPASASSSPSPSPEPMPSPAADSSCGTPPACSILLSGAVQLSGQTEAMLAVLLANYSYAPDDGSDWDTFARENSMPLGAVALQTISEQDTQAIVVDGGDKIYLAYRGTEETNIKDWITDLKFVPKEVPGLGNLHIGFVEAEDAAHAQVFDAITAMQAGSGKPIVTIGHSLGGALAMITAARLQQSQPGSVAGVYTFGSPRVGDAAWAQAYDSLGLGDITFRYINYKDPVPLLPSADITIYAHVGQQYYMDGVEQTGASMCALSPPGSGIPAYCTAAGWAGDSGVADTLVQAFLGQLGCASVSSHLMGAYIPAVFNLCLDTCTKAPMQACVPALQAPLTLYKVVVATSCDPDADSLATVDIYLKDAEGASTLTWPVQQWGGVCGLPKECSQATYVTHTPQTLLDSSTWKLYADVILDPVFADAYKPDYFQVTANGVTSKFCLVDQPPVDPANPGWLGATGEYLFEPCQ